MRPSMTTYHMATRCGNPFGPIEATCSVQPSSRKRRFSSSVRAMSARRLGMAAPLVRRALPEGMVRYDEHGEPHPHHTPFEASLVEVVDPRGVVVQDLTQHVLG